MESHTRGEASIILICTKNERMAPKVCKNTDDITRYAA